MISIRANEAAAQALGLPFMVAADLSHPDPGDLGAALTAAGLARDDFGGLFVPAVSFKVPDFAELTYRESQRNCWHLEDDDPAIKVDIDDEGTPHIDLNDQIRMLRRGIVLSRIVHDLAAGLPDHPPLRCITATNDTNGTFRFHQIRPGEQWHADDLDGYLEDMLIVIDQQPPTNPARPRKAAHTS